MATMTETPDVATKPPVEPSHEYHAEAHVLSGHLQRPVDQKIEKHAPVTLTGRRSGHYSRMADDVSIEGLITFKKGHTRVSGSKSLKPGHGWVTLSTSILEGLNVFDIVTADRMVSQVSTEHPDVDGHFPHVTFLGTQYENLRISGIPLKVTLNYGICGKKPAGDHSYLDELSFLKAVEAQTGKIAGAGDLPKDMQEQYDKRLATIQRLVKSGGSKESGEPSIICSLVTDIDKSIEKAIPGVRVIGHVLLIPDFGTVSLGELKVGEKIYEPTERPNNYFELTVIRMNMGCVGHGALDGGTAANNGHHNP